MTYVYMLLLGSEVYIQCLCAHQLAYNKNSACGFNHIV